MHTPSKNPRVALVTGASSGFGLLSTVALAQRGLLVYATMRDPERRGPLQEAAESAGVHVEVMALDVTKPATIESVATAIEQRSGGVDVLVNNAGIGLIGAFEETSDEELRTIFETNVFGLAAVTRAVLPGMRARRKGRIINISSVGGRVGTAGIAAYSASKFALEGLSEALSLELMPFGIDVVLVEPGAFRTEMLGPKRALTAQASDPASPYRHLTASIHKTMGELFAGKAPDPRIVAEVVALAATAEKPKLRYPVGKDAHGMFFLKGVLPDRSFERVFGWVFEKMATRSAKA